MRHFAIHQATLADKDAIVQLDAIAQTDPRRRAFILRVIEAGQCHVASTAQGLAVGYAALDYTFFEQGFVSILYVSRDHRRNGLGSMMMRHLESLCQTPKLFTSTNQSNIPMQHLLSKLGYSASGVIENLDEGDPELVYVKFLNLDFAAA